MNIGFWSCIVLAVIFGIIAMIFAMFKQRAVKLVSGFNSLSEKEQMLYDKAYISRDMRNQCFAYSTIMFIGALLSYFITPYMAIFALVIWLVVFFKEVHFDTHKAFKKYMLR